MFKVRLILLFFLTLIGYFLVHSICQLEVIIELYFNYPFGSIQCKYSAILMKWLSCEAYDIDRSSDYVMIPADPKMQHRLFFQLN
jgi:hypothetical protein